MKSRIKPQKKNRDQKEEQCKGSDTERNLYWSRTSVLKSQFGNSIIGKVENSTGCGQRTKDQLIQVFVS